MDVTVDRALAARRPDTRMLDLTSSLMQYLLAKACLYDFGGLVGSVCAPSLGEGSGALFGAMLRWQGPQGNRVRQEFVTILAGQEGTKVNSGVVSGWLMQPARFSAQMASVDSSRALYDAANKVAIQRLSELSNQYLIPESSIGLEQPGRSLTEGLASISPKGVGRWQLDESAFSCP